MVDDFLNQQNPVVISEYILIFAIVVIIIVLWKEFWPNLFGMLGSPSLTFQRLIGEISLPPAVFVVIICGFLMAITLLSAWTDKVTGDAVVAQFNIGFDWAGEQVTENLESVLPSEQIDFMGWLVKLQRDVSHSLGFFMLMPLACCVIWLLGGVGFHFASMFAGNKGGGSIGGLLTASAYPYLVAVLVLLWSVKATYAGWFNMFLLIIFGLYYIFVWTLLMREYGRYNYMKGFISFVIGFILTAVLVAVATVAVLWIVALIMGYT